MDVGIRLGTTGAPQVRSDLTSIGDAGEAEFKRLSRAAERAGKDADIAGAAFEAAFERKARAEAKLATMFSTSDGRMSSQPALSQPSPEREVSAASKRQNMIEEARLDGLARAMQPLTVAQDRYNRSVADLVKLQDSGRISLEQFLAEEQKAAAILEKVSGEARDAATAVKALTEAQAAGRGTTGARPDTIAVGKSASASASAFGELLPQQERQQAAVEALRSKLDPLYAAQKRYNDEVAHLTTLRPDLTEKEYATAVGHTERELEAAKRELAGHGSALGLNRSQFITAQSAVMRFSDSIMAGQSPLRAFALEAHKVGEVVSMDDGGVAGGMAKLSAIFSPVNVSIAAGAVALTATLGAWYSYDTAMNRLAVTAQGVGAVLGESAVQLEANAEAASRGSKLTVGAARDIETAYAGVARSGNVLTGLTAMTEDFAAATGQDLKSAQQDLVKVFGDTGVGAEDLAAKYGMLSAAQVEEIAKLNEAGEVEKAQQVLLQDLGVVVQGAAEHLTGLALAWDNVKRGASEAGAAVGSFMSRYGQTILSSAEQGFGMTGSETDWLFQKHGPQGKPRAPGDAKTNAFAGRADALVRGYQHDDRASVRQTIGQLTSAIRGGGTPEELKNWTEALDANRQALSTWKDAAGKANDVAAAREKFRQAKTPKERAAARAGLLNAQSEGEVVTAANVMLRASGAEAGFHNRGTKGGEKHAETLAREAESMEVAARGSLTLADAYLKGGAAAIEAEARKKAATDATKKGIDVEAQVRRQLDVLIGEQVATGAKSTAQLGDETRARAAANDNLAAGKLAAIDLTRSLSDEAALRPLLVLRALAHGDALDALNRVIERYTANLKAAHVEEGRSSTLVATDGLDTAITEANANRTYAGDTSGERERASARRAAQRQTKDWGTAGTADGDAYEQKAVGKVDAELGTRRADTAASALRSSKDQLAITQAEIGLVGRSADEHDRVVTRLQLQQQLATSLGDEYDKYAPAILAQADATEVAKQKLQSLASGWSEVTQAGDQLLDNVLNPSSWSNWGDMGKKVLADLEQEMIKLAILNPLKNMLFGESNTTIGSVFGSIFGGGQSAAAKSASAFSLPDLEPHNAAGTQDWSGGRTWLNENGPEIADLPGGTRIYPAAESRRMMAAANENGARSKVDIHLNTDLFHATVSDVADQRVGIAAPGIAAGGAAMGGQQAARARRRQLGTRG